MLINFISDNEGVIFFCKVGDSFKFVECEHLTRKGLKDCTVSELLVCCLKASSRTSGSKLNSGGIKGNVDRFSA